MDRGTMRIAFAKLDDGRLCAWTAHRPKRRPIQGSTMAAGRDLPHDLSQFVVESALALPHGFWGLLAMGATFESVRQRPTAPGRDVIRTHHEALLASERLVNSHTAAWRAHAMTPAGPALDAMLGRWRALRMDEELSVEWTTPRARAAGAPVVGVAQVG